MSTFSVSIIKILIEYKVILRSFLSLKEANARIHRLGLANKKMLCANDLVLYKIANNTLADLKAFIKKLEPDTLWRTKSQDYYDRLQKAILDFCVEGDKVVNIQQEISRLALEVIQILTLPAEKIIPKMLERIHSGMEKIRQYGSPEQYQKLEALIKESGLNIQV
jgi:hypothetical protein